MRLIPGVGWIVLIGTTAWAEPADKPATARFLEFELSAPFKPDLRKVVALPDDGGFKLRRKVVFRGHPFTAIVVAEGGKLSAVRLRWETKGSATRALTRWAEAFCQALGESIERRSPSPLGTPTPGKHWDPVVITHGRCAGVDHDVRLDVREEQSEASDFRRGEIEITAEPPPPPDPAPPAKP